MLAAFAGSVLADLLRLGIYRLVDDPLAVGLPLDVIIPAAFLNAAILAVLLYPARITTARLRSRRESGMVRTVAELCDG